MMHLMTHGGLQIECERERNFAVCARCFITFWVYFFTHLLLFIVGGLRCVLKYSLLDLANLSHSLCILLHAQQEKKILLKEKMKERRERNFVYLHKQLPLTVAAAAVSWEREREGERWYWL